MPACITQKKIELLDKLLSEGKNFAIVVHSNPDGDAIGSGVGMRRFLAEKRGKKAILVIPEAPAENLRFLISRESVCQAEKAIADAKRIIAECDTLIVQDMNAFNRAETLEEALRESKAKKILIDHHLNPDEGAFDLVFSQNDISSASELLYWVLKALPDGNALPQKTRQALFTGMTTDTNNFANSVYPSTFDMAKDLMQAGVDRNDILDRLYHSERAAKIHAFALMLGRHLTILPNGIAYIIMTASMRNTYRLRDGETEGLVNIPLNIDRVKVSIFLREAKGHYRVSIRAKKGWSANAIATKYFNGGGHELAAGGKLWFSSEIRNKKDAAAYIEGITAR